MIRYLSLIEVLLIYSHVMEQSGGKTGIRNLGALDSALAQPRMSFAGEEFYPTIVEKAATLGVSLIQNHPFVDGNKRTAHASMEIFLVLNGYDIDATVDEQEMVILQVASGEMERKEFADWLRTHTRERR